APGWRCAIPTGGSSTTRTSPSARTRTPTRSWGTAPSTRRPTPPSTAPSRSSRSATCASPAALAWPPPPSPPAPGCVAIAQSTTEPTSRSSWWRGTGRSRTRSTATTSARPIVSRPATTPTASRSSFPERLHQHVRRVGDDAVDTPAGKEAHARRIVDRPRVDRQPELVGLCQQRCGHGRLRRVQGDVAVDDARACRQRLVVAREREPRRAHRRLDRVHAVDGGEVEGRDQQPVDDVGGARPPRDGGG